MNPTTIAIRFKSLNHLNKILITAYVMTEKRMSANPITMITSKTILTSPTNFILLFAKGVITTPESIPIELAIP